MELDELRQMTAAGSCGVKEREAREEIFRLRLKLRTNQLDNHAELSARAPRAGADHDSARREDARRERCRRKKAS